MAESLPRSLAIASALLVWTTSATATAQATPPKENATEPYHTFLDGWLTEILYADRVTATKIYQEAIARKDLPNFQSELAALRLWESSWRIEDRKLYLSRSAYSVYRPGGQTSRFLRDIDQLGPNFESALDEADIDKLKAVREELHTLVKKHESIHTSRPIVPPQLASIRGEKTTVLDPTLDALRRERKAATDAGDQDRSLDLWRKIQRHRESKRRTASRRVIAKRMAEMTRLHLAGQHERANGMERALFPFPRRNTAARIQSRIRTWSASGVLGDQILRLRKNLDTRLTRATLAEERGVLEALRKRIDKLVLEEKPEEALNLAAQTPYRSTLLGER